MSVNQKRLEVTIFQGNNALPILEEVNEFSKIQGRRPYEGLSEEEKTLLLARPDILWLSDKSSGINGFTYKKIREFGQVYPFDYKQRRGARIFVCYEQD